MHAVEKQEWLQLYEGILSIYYFTQYVCLNVCYPFAFGLPCHMNKDILIPMSEMADYGPVCRI